MAERKVKKMKEKKVLWREKVKFVCFREREIVNLDRMECGSDIVQKDR